MTINSWWEAVCDVCGATPECGMLPNETRASFTKEMRKRSWSVNYKTCRCPKCRGKRMPRED